MMIKFTHSLVTALALASVGIANAASTPEEISQLGTTLTKWGAEVAGNQDGTIPKYTGGLTTPPPEFVAGSGLYPDPYKADKPLFTVTAKNAAEHADLLTEGQKALFARYPEYRMDIYPTRRSVAYPQAVLDATLKNAQTAATASEGNDITGAAGGIPFPIPKTGNEAMWNHILAFSGEAYNYYAQSFYVNTTGRIVGTSTSDLYVEFPYYHANATDNTGLYLRQYVSVDEPAAMSGQQFIIQDSIHSLARRAWQYIPGQRRVKVAPELAYDTTHPSTGVTTMDDTYIFYGSMDRYSFKLVGKKEVYLPYNNYRLYQSAASGGKAEQAVAAMGTAKFLNPDLVRWERHRVWVVEADLLPGKRHMYKKRVFYWDEDAPSFGMSDQYDSAGKLLRFGMSLPIQLYDKNTPFGLITAHYDLSSNIYVVTTMPIGPLKVGSSGPSSVKLWSSAEWSPEKMTSRGLR